MTRVDLANDVVLNHPRPYCSVYLYCSNYAPIHTTSTTHRGSPSMKGIITLTGIHLPGKFQGLLHSYKLLHYLGVLL